ncbi:MAG: hypothetical protein ISEC1_P0711 [Thiomicrorhabdus sp.]|nr:MAG: hypothetical protein ISEC1_P0711 [Thiomicrorhabdus sp.]
MSKQGNNSSASQEIIECMKAVDDLPHSPAALVKLEKELATNPDVNIGEIVLLVAQDPSLAAGIIGVVNSAKYTTGKLVSDLNEAIVRVGVKDVRAMAHAINYKSSIRRKPPFGEVEFLRHALVSAFISQNLAKHLKLNKGEAFLCGLMHDMGAYLLAVEDRDKYVQVIKLVGFEIDKLVSSESRIYGTHHAMMGARLLKEWNFSQKVIMGVAFHHAPNLAEDRFKDYAYLTCLAEQGTFRVGVENGIADLSDEDRETPSIFLLSALSYFDLSLEVFDKLAQEGIDEVGLVGM